jgi:DNA modification methylase
MFVDEHSTVLDPTCGSGTALAMAKEFNSANILGIEINPAYAADAELLLAGTRPVVRRAAGGAAI